MQRRTSARPASVMVTQAGFERGTGVMINIVSPEQACDVMRSVGASA